MTMLLPAHSFTLLPSNLFSSHMVLQREHPIPVWGVGAAGKQVRVSLAGQTGTTKASADGKWRVVLAPMAAAENLDLTIESNNERCTFNDVAIGEVWLCSGQSNMEYTLDRQFYPSEVDQSGAEGIRFFAVGKNPVPQVANHVNGTWQRLEPANAAQCSAVAYFMGRRLHRELGVLVGLIISAYGGSTGEAWVSKEGLSQDPDLRHMAENEIAGMASVEKDIKRFSVLLAEWGQPLGVNDTEDRGSSLAWQQPGTDPASWKPCSMPFNPDSVGIHGGASVWLRRSFDVPATALGKDYDLDLGWISVDVRAWWNGVELSPPWPESPRFFTTARHFKLPSGLLHKGNGELVLRAYYPTGGWTLPNTTKKIGVPVADPAALDNTWSYRLERQFPVLTQPQIAARPTPPDRVDRHTPTYLYNGMIAPLIPYANRGVAWYQGEENFARPLLYRKVLSTLIHDWRMRWSAPDLPFLIVQLPNFNPAPDYSYPPPAISDWTMLRETQYQVVKATPSTDFVVTIDVGEADIIHPPNKKDVGVRLAGVALDGPYGLPIPAHGPEYVSMTAEGDALRIHFKYAEGLHSTRSGPVKEFMIAGPDKQFVWADATVEGETVLVRAPSVPHPQAVRFAWVNNPSLFSLYNGAGLPAAPFRTDDWPTTLVEPPYPPYNL